ncbi:protein tyrosine/serine phosphatase [Oceaniovalibus guishaninsula JLT2003]|uniref:Protein tyrosine/serine phosphatase n=1 Tax=Oceaniovalibus guishaninsula JLT2003 TaxID=1231392 RepID=K2IA82_9RHOB|nr:tyrosine-protein phosphatase [Oceaniovalibus guishaninsula]EKE45875.1 protein tyrosine/serine phosphatase [Oceaniovalibus guishaninsula JLT2003]
MRRVVLLALAGFLALAGWVGVLQATGNYHAVIAGTLYRSAQVTPESLTRYVAEDGIASVLNLRGALPGTGWYDDELAASDRLGLVHADYKMSASHGIGQQEATDLLAIFATLPRPILVHCKSGADRTGLAAALYLARIAQAGEAAAERALSLRYGHFAAPFLSRAWPMDRSFEAMEPWLGYHDS